MLEDTLFPMLRLSVGLLCKQPNVRMQDSILPHVLGLRRLKLDVGLVDYEDYTYGIAPKSEEYSIAPIIRGVRFCDMQLSTGCLLQSAMMQVW
jgi:hypothetical protein